MSFIRFFLFLSILFVFLPARAKDIPALKAHINDISGSLSKDTVAQLEAKLQEHEKNTSNQVAVLIIDSLEGEILEEYSLKVAENWKLGQKGKDNGVLLLIVKNDRKLRIEVGYGLESALTDAQSNRIINYGIVPKFKSGEFDNGVTEGVNGILATIQGEAYTPPIPPATTTHSFEENSKPGFFTKLGDIIGTIVTYIIAFVILLIILFILAAVYFNNLFKTTNWFYFILAGAWLGAVPFFIYSLYISEGFAIKISITQILLTVAWRIFAMKTDRGKKILGKVKRSDIGKFLLEGWESSGSYSSSSSSSSWSSGSSSSYSSSSSSSSSYSGGGGSFGGGGSSGSW